MLVLIDFCSVYSEFLTLSFVTKTFDNFDQTCLNTDSKCGRVKPRSDILNFFENFQCAVCTTWYVLVTYSDSQLQETI